MVRDKGVEHKNVLDNDLRLHSCYRRQNQRSGDTCSALQSLEMHHRGRSSCCAPPLWVDARLKWMVVSTCYDLPPDYAYMSPVQSDVPLRMMEEVFGKKLLKYDIYEG